MLDQGVKVLNKELNCVLMAHALSRISYSVAEPKDGLLAFAAKDPEGINSQTYCHAFIFDNPKEASEINTTLGNAFRLAYCKRTLKRRTKCDNTSQHTNSSSSTGTSDSALILRKRANVCPNNARQPNGNCQRNNLSAYNGGNHGNNGIHGNAMQLGNGTHGLRLEGLRAGEPVSRNTAKSPALSNHDRYQADIKHLADLDPESRIKDWLHDASPVNITPEDDTSPVYPETVGKGRCPRRGSCVPVSNTPVLGVQHEQLRRPSRVCDDQMSIPPELKEQEWFQAGIPRHIALECLSMECEGAFIVRNSQTHKGCYALSLRGPGRGSSGTYHYLISQSVSGFYFQVVY
ncbi:hypothetical protein ACHWQZ_G015212 [Mnemiopsis leidyi]